MTRTAEEIAQAHKACLDGADTINVVIATHNKGDKLDKDKDGNDVQDKYKGVNQVVDKLE